ncbi:MAG: T9SS type A sorting domain-containing protein [Chitinophagaceae bacterium]|nr:T9SS type A sorting domain-containing protein [Chitinophagaceae bacterium]
MKLKQLLLFIVILLASCFLSFSIFAQPTTAGMLAHFRFNGNTTNSGTATVSATTVSTSYTTDPQGNANSAVQFAGNLNSYVDFVDNGNLDFTGTNNFTVAFSFFFNGSSTSGLVDNCLNYGGWGVWLWSTVAGTWNLQFNYKNNSVGSAAATNFIPNRWNHVTAVRNNGTISLYVNGAFRLSAAEGTTTPTYPINMQAGAMCYGSFTPPRYNPFGGKIEELRVYNRALSGAEIAILAPWSLPLQLGDFTALKKPTGIQLNWKTISEQNTSHFEVERSLDGSNYTTIGSVTAAGNSSSDQYYIYTDMQAPAKTVFYRLKMVDLDRKFTYSPVIAVKNNSSLLTLDLFPNPASDVLQVQIPSERKEATKINIIDATGKQIHVQSIQLNEGTNAISIPVNHLLKGTYYLVVESEDGRQSRSFIKM